MLNEKHEYPQEHHDLCRHEVELLPLGQGVSPGVALGHALVLIEHHSQIGQVVRGQSTEDKVGEHDEEMSLLILEQDPVSDGLGLAAGADGRVKDLGQPGADSVLDVGVESQREEDGADLEVEPVEQRARQVGGQDGDEGAVVEGCLEAV